MSPYASNAQRKAMHAKAARGEIKQSVVDEFDTASKGMKLPSRAAKKPATMPKAKKPKGR